MSKVEEGVVYPREVEAPFGLPPGWKAIERAYTASSKSYGKTYVRYDSPNGKHKALSSVKKAIEDDAKDRGLDPVEAVRTFEKAVQKDKEDKQKAREEAGFLAGEKREQAVEAFRAKYGPLDGATVGKIDGWRAESLFRETCNQTAVTYYSPEGRSYGTVKSVEAFFGMQVMAGKRLPEIEAARRKVLVDERGRPINEARQEINYTRASDGDVRLEKRPRTAFVEEDFKECGLLVTSPIKEGQENRRIDALGIDGSEKERLEKEAQELRAKLMERQKFETENAEDLLLLALGCPDGHRLSEHLVGMYYQMPESWNERPCYQRVLLAPGGRLACKGTYIFWSVERSCWKMGPLNDSKAGYAYCVEDRKMPTELEASWRIHTPSSLD